MNQIQDVLDIFRMKYSDLSINNVNTRFRELVKENHPDTCNGEIIIDDIDQLKGYRDLLIDQCKYNGEKEIKNPSMATIFSIQPVLISYIGTKAASCTRD